MKIKFKLAILTIYLLASIYCFGQETMIVEKKGESFYVIKADTKIKHGPYQCSVKKKIVEKGQYENGNKVGMWEFYNSDGVLEQKYDYTTKKLIFNSDTETFGGKIILDGNPVEISPDTLPVFIGGHSRYNRYLEKNLKYPKGAKPKGVEGRQLVLASLSKQGEILNATVFRTISPDIDEEAIRLIMELPKEWIPAKYQNNDVDVLIVMPVLFRLD